MESEITGQTRARVVGIGELLWDNLPAGPRLGGAPANFAVFSARLGNQASVVSCLGDDPEARPPATSCHSRTSTSASCRLPPPTRLAQFRSVFPPRTNRFTPSRPAPHGTLSV